LLEPDERDRLVDVARLEVVAGVELEALAHREPGLRVRFLQHRADAVSPRGVTVSRVDAEHADLPFGARAEPLEDLDGRRLACAVRPEEREDLAPLHLEVDSGHGLERAIALAQPVHGDDRLHAASVRAQTEEPGRALYLRRDMVSKPVEQLSQVIVRFAGDSGDGMQLTGSQFTNEAALLGNDISTLPDFPAEIRAPAGSLPGVSGFQLHFADHDILTP